MVKQPAILDGFRLSDAQRAAALAQGGDVAVTAGAGTGKTRTLVARYLALLAGGLPLRRIVAVTFTRKAAREMRNRIRQEIGNYLSRTGLDSREIEAWSATYNELDAARINTIHNICAEILRTHPAEAAVDPRFTILDETQSSLLLLEAVEATLAWAVDQEGLDALFALLREGQMMELISALINHRLSAQEVFTAVPPETILTHWREQLVIRQEAEINNLLADPDFLAARQVLEQNAASDAHDKAEVQRRQALSAFQNVDSLADKIRNFTILDEINLRGGSQKNWPAGKEQLDNVKDALRCLRDNYRGQALLKLRINDQDEAIAAAMPAIQTLLQYANKVYQALKGEREGLDFDDLEALAIYLLENHDDVRAYWQGQVQALLVDEFQDTNESQRHFIRLLCPDAGKLFIVGDAKQSIYRFRGADVTVFSEEKEGIAAQNGQLIDLETSYRAHAPLLQGMNCLLEPILGLDYPGRPAYVAPFAPLKPAIKTADNALSAPYIECHLTLGTKPQALPRAATALAEQLSRLHRDHAFDFGDMAILCRASNAFQYYENAFDNAGIPYVTVAGKGFYERPEIRDLLNALAAIADPHDDLALTGLLRSPACGLSDVTLYRLSSAREEGNSLWDTLNHEILLDEQEEAEKLQAATALIRDLNRQSGRIPVADLLKRFLDRTQYRAGLRRAGQQRALRNVAKLLRDVHLSELVNVDDFLEYQATLRDTGSREGEARSTAAGAVQIMTIHAAKGLEFPLVVLGDAAYQPSSRQAITLDPQLGLLLPYKNEDGERAASYNLGTGLAQLRDDAETDRLLYVALTRAEQMLLISGCLTQKQDGALSWKGWLGQLAEVAGMVDADLSAYEDAGEGSWSFDYSVQDTAVRATFYEPNYHVQITAPEAPQTEPVDEPFALQELQKPLFEAQGYEPEQEEIEQRVWQVIPAEKSTAAPARLVGTLVHQALSKWRFPGPGFADWVRARAREYGLTDDGRLRQTEREVLNILNRFRRHALYEQIEAAEKRWHELPFTCAEEGSGIIDLLFQDAGGWMLVEFKTDKVRDAAALQDHFVKKYEQQLRQYGRAAEQMLGVSPNLTLCFLNGEEGVHCLSINS